ncbi:hypothetical protein LCGC14_1332950 [marine sediment metagenome]|uniref:Uncharacterized protein n=1 Tax=marine sediment metagenome TaxID=412755 RepID=A0A0F9MWV3_9ZZZZ
MKFLLAMVKDGNPITRIDFGGDIGEKWATTTQAVVDFAKTGLKSRSKDGSYAGDEVTVEHTVTNGKYNVTKITKVGTGGSPTPAGAGKPTCSDCGIEVKDAKYKKCFKCNEKNPAPRASKSANGNFRTPEQITKDEVGSMTARTMAGLTGVIDPNNVTAIIRTVYQTYKDLVK